MAVSFCMSVALSHLKRSEGDAVDDDGCTEESNEVADQRFPGADVRRMGRTDESGASMGY
jgi:hypothetical protein